jgi:hypothetical protein
MSLPLWFNLLRASHAVYRNRKDIKKDFAEAYNQAAEGVRAGYASYKKEMEFIKANPKPSLRVPLWKGCVWIFLPLFIVELFSGLLAEHQDSWFVQNTVWFLIAWLAGSTVVFFCVNRTSKAARREWERLRDEHVNVR